MAVDLNSGADLGRQTALGRAALWVTEPGSDSALNLKEETGTVSLVLWLVTGSEGTARFTVVSIL